MSARVSLRHLRCFVAVADAGSFTVAAGRLFQTQSSLTATIQQLEEAVGVKLFDRTTRRVELTSEAVWFKGVAEKILREFDSAIADLKATASSQRGHIRIAASPSTMVHIVSPALISFREAYPQISISVQDGGSDMIERAVMNGEVDFGVSSRLNSFSDLDYVHLVSDPFGVIFPAGHPVGKLKEPICWSDLEPYDFIGMTSDTGIGFLLDEHPELGLKVRAQASDRASSTTSLYTLLRLGGKLSVLPALAARTGALSSFEFKMLSEPPLAREIYLITRHQRSLSPSTQRLLAVLMSTIGQSKDLFGAPEKRPRGKARQST